MSDSNQTEEQPEQLSEDAADASSADQDTDNMVDEAGDELTELREKAEANWQLYVRAQAEMENLRRRSEKDLENAHKFALEKFASELLAVKDSLELGLSATDVDVDKLREGSELTLKMLAQALAKFNIIDVDPMGESFDPNSHQAMTMQETAEHAPNTVIAVMQKGYLINDRLLRPAMVVVAKAPKE
ncbi:MAG: nucleotide exchange factor GrpE [Gammaproteobacteria bacterium]|nr:nucleotide exchange factor GrpE [Gammaproteobacteria bacterium]